MSPHGPTIITPLTITRHMNELWHLLLGLAQGIVRVKATTLSEVYSYTLNINRIFI